MKRAILYPLAVLLSLTTYAKATHKQDKPFVFIENKGQLNTNSIDYKIEQGALTVFISNDALHYQWAKPGSKEGETETYRMDVSLLNADKHVKAIAADKQVYTEYHYTPSHSSGITAATYKKVTYKNVYPGIDWVLHINNDKLEYDFVVHPGADAKQIKLKYDGATKLAIRNGKITAATPMGTVTENAPYSYVLDNKKKLRSSFCLQDNVLSFNIVKCKETYVIDPVLNWSTYFGGTLLEALQSTAADVAGNLYMAGYTNSTFNIATNNAFKNTINGLQDAMLVKFNAAGQRVWATYYGGTLNNEMFNSVTCDKFGNLYAAGQTNSSDLISTPLAHNSNNGGGSDVFLVKFDTSGKRKWATYYGGTGNETGGYVTCDKATNVYICGSTSSATSIAAGNNIHQSVLGISGGSGFLVKFDSTGIRRWGTYYSQSTTFRNIICDDDCNLYGIGTTHSASGIHTPNAYDTTYSGNGQADGFIVKFDSSGLRQWGTYFGGNIYEDLSAIAIDADGTNLYIGGQTNSSTGISTPGSFQEMLSLNTDGFLAKIHAPTGKLIWSTYYGGNGVDQIAGIARNQNDKIIVTGFTYSSENIATSNAYQDSLASINGDAFMAIFDTAGYRYYGTYIGGSDVDYGTSVTYTDTGNIYIGGRTRSVNNIATVGSFQDTISGSSTIDLFLAKFTEDWIVIKQPFNYTSICPGDTIQVNYNVNRNFTSGNIFTVELSDSAGAVFAPTVIGQITTTNGGTISCIIPYNTKGSMYYRLRIKSSAPVYISTDVISNVQVLQGPQKPEVSTNSPFCEGWHLSLNTTGTLPGSIFKWTGPDNFTTNIPNFHFTNTKVKDGGTYILTATKNGCKASDTTEVIIYPKSFVLNARNNGPLCEDSLLLLLASDTSLQGNSYSWTGPNGFIDTSRTPIRNSVGLNAAGDYVVTASLAGCGSDTTTLVVAEKPTVTATANSPLDSGEKLTLIAVTSAANATFSWAGPDTFYSPLQVVDIPNMKSKRSGAYIVTIQANGCTASDTVFVVVNSIASSSVSLTPNPTKGNPVLRGTVLYEQAIPLIIYNALGQSVYKETIQTSGLQFNHTLALTGLPNGAYRLKLRMDGEIKVLEFVMLK